ISARFGAGVRNHFRRAPAAASTASSTSWASESGNSPSSSPVAGLRLWKGRPERAGIQRPPMKFRNFSGMFLFLSAWDAIERGGRYVSRRDGARQAARRRLVLPAALADRLRRRHRGLAARDFLGEPRFLEQQLGVVLHH